MSRKIIVAILLSILLHIACSSTKPPASFISAFDEPGIWQTVEIPEELKKEVLWQIVSDGLTQKFDLEVIDKDSG